MALTRLVVALALHQFNTTGPALPSLIPRRNCAATAFRRPHAQTHTHALLLPCGTMLCQALCDSAGLAGLSSSRSRQDLREILPAGRLGEDTEYDGWERRGRNG